MKNKKKVWIIGGGVIVGGLLLVGILGQNGNKNEADLVGPTDGSQVQVGKAEKADVLTKVSSSGVLYADVEETIFADSANQVKSVEKEVGDSIKAGDVLFILDEEVRTTLQKEIEKIDLNIANAKLALGQLQSASTQEVLQAQTSLKELDKAELDAKEAIRSAKENIRLSETDVQSLEKQYVLTKSLFESGLASQAELDQAKKERDTLKEKITSLENQLVSLEKGLATLEIQKENANYQLSVLLNEVEDEKKNQNIQMRQNEIKTLELQKADLLKELTEFTDKVISPIDGIIAEMMVEEGAYFAQGNPLAKVINTEKLIVKSEISPYIIYLG